MASSIEALDDDCLSLVLGELGAVDRLTLETVSRRFQKCMFRVVDSLKITFVPPGGRSNRKKTDGSKGRTSNYKFFLKFNGESLQIYFDPPQFLVIASILTSRIMLLSLEFQTVSKEMLDVVKVLNWCSLKVKPGDHAEAQTDLLFRHLGDRINKLEIIPCSNKVSVFKAKWTLKWFQAGVFIRLAYFSFLHADFP